MSRPRSDRPIPPADAANIVGAEDSPAWPGSRERVLDAIAGSILRVPLLVVTIAIVLAGAGALLAATGLELDADTNSLIGEGRPFMRPFRAFLDEFGDLEYLYVVIDAGGDRDAAHAAVADLEASLRSVPDLPGVHAFVTPDEQRILASAAMSETELAGLLDARGAFDDLLATRGPDPIVHHAIAGLDTALAPDTPIEARRTSAAEAILLLFTLTDQVVADRRTAAGAVGGLGRALAPRVLDSRDGAFAFIEILPRKDYGRLDAIREPLRAIRESIASVAQRHPDVDIGLTGKPVLQADELATTDRDMQRAATGALAVIAVLFVIVFRGVRRPLLAIVAFACAFAWASGAATLLVGRLNLLSIVFMLVLVGVGLDYGVHVLARWVESRRDGDARDAVRAVLRRTTPANLGGAITSAGVFLLALATPFQGLRELGVIAGVGLLLCVIAMTVVAPALLFLTERHQPAGHALAPARRERRARTRPPRGSAIVRVSIAGIVVIGALAAIANGLRFETNLLELQAENLESVRWERRISERDASQIWFGAVIADDLAEAARVRETARSVPEIGRTFSVLDVIAPPTPRRAVLLHELAQAIERASPESDRPSTDPTDVGDGRSRDIAPVDPARLATAESRVRALAGLAGLRLGFDDDDVRALVALADDLRFTRSRLDLDPAGVADAMRGATEAARAMLLGIAHGATLDTRAVLPAAIRARLVSPGGRALVSLYPVGDLWNDDALDRFVTAIRSIDPDATGVPITQYESIRDMTHSFLTMSLAALVLVALVVLADFRAIGPTVRVLLTLVLGLLTTLGVLATTGFSLNLANFFAVPILIGLGVDSALHMEHHWRDVDSSRHDADKHDHGTVVRAIALTAVTTGIGFGALVSAEHRGLRSLGAVMAIGSIVCLLATAWLLPALHRLAEPGAPRSARRGGRPDAQGAEALGP